MRRTLHQALLLAALTGVAFALTTSHARRQDKTKQDTTKVAGQGPTEDEVVRVNTALVTVPLSVKDRRGKTVMNLRREDFRLYEDGVEQEIAYFESPEAAGGDRAARAVLPLTVALLLDVSDSTEFKLKQIQDAADAFVEQLREGDRVMIVAFDKRVQVLTEATSDRVALRAAITRARTGGGTSLYGALDAVINQAFRRLGGRKAIVLFTDGVDTASRGATYESTIRAAEESDAVIYPVQYNTYGDFADNPSRQTYNVDNMAGSAHVTKNGELASEAYKRAALYLRLLAEKTGGHFQYTDSTKNLGRSFARVADELRLQYTLGYYPKNRAAGGAERQIDVRVGVTGVAVRARKSYVYQPPGLTP